MLLGQHQVRRPTRACWPRRSASSRPDTTSSSWPRGAPGGARSRPSTASSCVVSASRREATSFVRHIFETDLGSQSPASCLRSASRCASASTRSTSTTRRTRSSWSRRCSSSPAGPWSSTTTTSRRSSTAPTPPTEDARSCAACSRGLERLSCRLADRVVTANGSHRDVEVERCGVDPSRIAIVRNGPDPDRVRRDPSAAPEPGAPFTVGWAGTIGHHDGLDHLLLAMRHLVDDHGLDDARCVLFGDGPAFDDTRASRPTSSSTTTSSSSGACPVEELPPAARGRRRLHGHGFRPTPTTTAAR